MPDPVKLACLLGLPGPPELAPNLATFTTLPESVLATFAEVLEPNLAPVIDDRAETRVKRYCRLHEIEPDTIGPSVRACRFLFTNAVKSGAGRDGFTADVRAMLPEAQAEATLARLLPIFDVAFPQLVKAAVLRSVAEHGKVVQAVHWRIETIRSSDHGLKLDVPVATLTFQYQEGPNAGQASFQLLPDQAAELRRALAMLIE